MFVARGPAFREGVCIPRAEIIDEGCTFARILGDALPQAQGRCLEELLK